MLSLTSATAFAQHEGHQMPGMPSFAVSRAVSSCAESSQAVTRALDAATIRINEARQTNEPAKLRAAVSDLQLALGQMRTLLASCVAASQAGAAAGSMPTEDHSLMSMSPAPGAPPEGGTPLPGSASTDHSQMNLGSVSPAARPSLFSTDDKLPVTIAFRSKPTPPRAGDNEFEVALADSGGNPVPDADVSLAFYMPPMPAMNMAEMRSTVKLLPAGNGVYGGEGSIGMAGDWDVTIAVSRNQQEIGSKKVKVTAR